MGMADRQPDVAWMGTEEYNRLRADDHEPCDRCYRRGWATGIAAGIREPCIHGRSTPAEALPERPSIEDEWYEQDSGGGDDSAKGAGDRLHELWLAGYKSALAVVSAGQRSRRMTRHVWVVEHGDYENSEIWGAYSTKERAQEQHEIPESHEPIWNDVGDDVTECVHSDQAPEIPSGKRYCSFYARRHLVDA